jgi:hypothetical protein
MPRRIFKIGVPLRINAGHVRANGAVIGLGWGEHATAAPCIPKTARGVLKMNAGA